VQVGGVADLVDERVAAAEHEVVEDELPPALEQVREPELPLRALELVVLLDLCPLVDEVRLHHVPIVLGGGTPLFDDALTHLAPVPVQAEPSRLATHVIYQVTDNVV
jgi:dihydrofolate reductase